MMKPRISLFAEHEREDRRTNLGDPLVGLAKHVDFEALAASVDEAAPRLACARSVTISRRIAICSGFSAGGLPPTLTDG
jgi:hypothetical protein